MARETLRLELDLDLIVGEKSKSSRFRGPVSRLAIDMCRNLFLIGLGDLYFEEQQ